MAITIRKHRKRGNPGKKGSFEFAFSNRVLFGFSISLLLMLILVCLIKPDEGYYGAIGFGAWLLGWLIASERHVREWAVWERPVMLAVTAPILALLLVLFLWNFVDPWCHRLLCPPEPGPSQTPTPTSPTEEVAATPAPEVTPTPTVAPPTTTEESYQPADYYTIAIVDVLMVPRSRHGDQSPRYEAWNEYVEIYNYGDSDVDLEGLWLTDGAGMDQPDQLVSWDSRFSGYGFPSAADTSTTILPAGEFGLILSGRYIYGDMPHNDLIERSMSAGSVILTIAENDDDSTDLLGDSDGLECHTPGSEDFVVIYRGTRQAIEYVVASYGIPKHFAEGMSPAALEPSSSGAFPATCGTWGGVRVSDPFASADRQELYWQFYLWKDRSPGYE
jgi:hypothetical protein